MSRRGFLERSAAIAGSVGLGCLDRAFPGPWCVSNVCGDLPEPASSGIEHVVVVMMENRSFDHFLGWLPNADGRQAGLTYTDTAGAAHATHPLAPDFQGCGHQDPDHSYAGARVEYHQGACDGWLRVNDVYSIGYYRRGDLAFCGQAAADWTTFDRYFCAMLGPTLPNRLYLHAAQTDRLDNSFDVSTLPTIWDRLESANVEGRYYYGDLPLVALWGTKYQSISRTLDYFYRDCAAGALPAVAFVDPGVLGETTGAGADDHPFTDVRAGESFLNRIYEGVTRGPGWDGTVLVVTFDEWGGFFDHVAPSAALIPDASRAAGDIDGLRGFRTPALVISPFARRQYTSHTLYDHTSVLRLIEWRWNLPPLTVRDATANNLADELDFARGATEAPAYAVPSVTSTACPAPLARKHWAGLRVLARQSGWTI